MWNILILFKYRLIPFWTALCVKAAQLLRMFSIRTQSPETTSNSGEILSRRDTFSEILVTNSPTWNGFEPVNTLMGKILLFASFFIQFDITWWCLWHFSESRCWDEIRTYKSTNRGNFPNKTFEHDSLKTWHRLVFWRIFRRILMM